MESRTASKLIEHFVTKAPPGGEMLVKLALGEPGQDKSDDQRQFEGAIQRSLKRPSVFYLLQYKSIDEATGYLDFYALGYLTLADGSYRLITDNLLLGLSGMPVRRVRMGGSVAASSLVKKVSPQYPEEARHQRISGTVRMHAIIGTDGALKQIEVMYGDPILAEAAVRALKQWRYRQTTLDGVPVEIDTSVDMIFSLNR